MQFVFQFIYRNDNKKFERVDRIAAINPFKISFSFWGNKAERIYLVLSTVCPPGSPGCMANRTSGGSTSFLAEALSPRVRCHFTKRTKRTALPPISGFEPGIPAIVKL